jgi:hypothetical protein
MSATKVSDTGPNFFKEKIFLKEIACEILAGDYFSMNNELKESG